MGFALIIAQSQEPSIVREPRAKGILQNSWSTVIREVLESCIRRNMRNLNSVLFPFRAIDKHLGSLVELQVCDRCRQVSKSFEWFVFNQLCVRTDIKEVHSAHFAASCQQ